MHPGTPRFRRSVGRVPASQALSGPPAGPGHIDLAIHDDVEAAPDLTLADDFLARLIVLAPNSVWLVHADVDGVAAEDGPQQPVDEDAHLAVEGLDEAQQHQPPGDPGNQPGEAKSSDVGDSTPTSERTGIADAGETVVLKGLPATEAVMFLAIIWPWVIA